MLFKIRLSLVRIPLIFHIQIACTFYAQVNSCFADLIWNYIKVKTLQSSLHRVSQGMSAWRGSEVYMPLPLGICSGAEVEGGIDPTGDVVTTAIREGIGASLPPDPEQTPKFTNSPINNRSFLALVHIDSASFGQVERVQPTEDLTVACQSDLQHRWHKAP
jgi:hypothetical protein